LAGQDLDAFLEIDEGDVEAEDVAGETGYVFESIAGVCNGKNPVHYKGPPEFCQMRFCFLANHTYNPIKAMKAK